MADMIELCNNFLDLEEKSDRVDEEIKRLKSEKEDLQRQMFNIGKILQEIFIENEVRNFRLRGRLVYIHKQMWAKVKDQDQQRAIETLRGCGLGWLVEEKFNTHTVSSHIRECDEQGIEIPDEFYEAFDVNDVFSIRSKKG